MFLESVLFREPLLTVITFVVVIWHGWSPAFRFPASFILTRPSRRASMQVNALMTAHTLHCDLLLRMVTTMQGGLRVKLNEKDFVVSRDD